MVAGWKNIQFLEFCRVAITIRNHGDVTAQPLTLLQEYQTLFGFGPEVITNATVQKRGPDPFSWPA
jgi:hypothetical protein